MPPIKVPFNLPSVAGQELEFIQEAIQRGQISGDGYFTNLCSFELGKITGVETTLLTHSGTAALEMAAILCELKPGDEVIMPSFTFVSTANAFVLRGAVPVFVDVDSKTFNINPLVVKDAITQATKAIVVVHYAGISCDMDHLMAIAAKHRLPVVEDAAQAMLSSYNGKN